MTPPPMGHDRVFRINILGCGSAKPTLRHNPSCTVVEYGSQLMMIDCGEGAQREMLRQGLKPSRLKHVFLTHLHGDHVLGLPGLVSTLALSFKNGSLTVHTTEEGRRILSTIIGYFNADSEFEVRFEVFDPSVEAVIFEDKNLTVRTIPLKHRVPTVGFVFEEKLRPRHFLPESIERFGIPYSAIPGIKEGDDFIAADGSVIPNSELTTPPLPPDSYAHIGDTLFIPELADKIKGVSLLYHESTYLSDRAADAIKHFHCTATEAATVGLKAGAGKVVLGHYSARYDDSRPFEEEARLTYPPCIAADEGMRIDVRR